MSKHWQGLSVEQGVHTAAHPRKGNHEWVATALCSALPLTLAAIRGHHTLNKEQRGWSESSSAPLLLQVISEQKHFWENTANLGELCVVALWCRLLSMRDWDENTELIVYAHIDYAIKLTIN